MRSGWRLSGPIVGLTRRKSSIDDYLSKYDDRYNRPVDLGLQFQSWSFEKIDLYRLKVDWFSCIVTALGQPSWTFTRLLYRHYISYENSIFFRSMICFPSLFGPRVYLSRTTNNVIVYLPRYWWYRKLFITFNMWLSLHRIIGTVVSSVITLSILLFPIIKNTGTKARTSEAKIRRSKKKNARHFLNGEGAFCIFKFGIVNLNLGRSRATWASARRSGLSHGVGALAT